MSVLCGMIYNILNLEILFIIDAVLITDGSLLVGTPQALQNSHSNGFPENFACKHPIPDSCSGQWMLIFTFLSNWNKFLARSQRKPKLMVINNTLLNFSENTLALADIFFF